MDRLQPLTKSDVQKLLGVSERTVENWIARGILPPPARIGGRRVYWARAVIERWLEEQLDPAQGEAKRRGRPRSTR